MHGQQSEERLRKRHMWPVPANGTVGDSSSIKFFSKDDRKISIGDCALFQAGNAPPFIGIIRCMTEDKEGQIKLGVNWLYRPADVKLGKGVVLEAAPNEVFYSFHKDEISAASLLHPCKVAFLSKDVELPAGVSSFVCRRVYDTTNKRLWWLTDQDYTDERQEEVDQLLDKTRQEMHAVMQSGGPSPKDMNGMSSTLKTGSDTAHNSSFPSQGKGKKRERADHNTDPVKRERLFKSDGSEIGHFKQDSSMRPEEIARITNRDGSLINTECAGQLVHLMQLDRNDAARKGIDLASWRKELVGVIANTDRDDCLSQFVQLKGLPILHDWLQEAHKGKTGDDGSPKESDKVIEELLLTLLYALGRLPVDLDVLKTCTVGKSVNHLRYHKNLDIRKKAKKIYDTWKKRVEKEMNNNDTKSGLSQGVTLPCKQASGEVSHAHGGRRGGPVEAAKSSMPLNSSVKAISNRSAQTDVLSRSTSVPSASTKVSPLLSSTISSKDSHCKEEKSSSSSQSQNNSQSWSSEPGKAAGSSWKEDARSSTAASMNAKGSSAGSCHRKSSNSVVGSSKPGAQKEAGGGKSVAWSKNTVEKPLQSGQTSDRTIDNVRGDNANSHRLIVKLPNPGRSPAPCTNGGPIEDSFISASRVSSPITSDKHDANDSKIKIKTEVSRASVVLEVNTESWQSNEVKDGVTECEDGDRSSTGIPSEDRSRTGEDIEKTPEISKTALSPSSGKLNNPTKCHLDAETDKTGEKYRTTAVSVKGRSHLSRATSIGTDDGGMKLLANVAVSEPDKDEQVSSAGNSGKHEFMMADGTLCGSTRKCSMDVLNSQPGDREVDKSKIDTKEVKDFPVLRGHQDASSDDMPAKFPAAFVHQKDGSDHSKHLESSASAVQEDSKHSSETPGAAPLSTGGDEQHLKSDQATDQTTEQVPMDVACISRCKTEEVISTENTKNDDGQQRPQLETSNIELSTEKDLKHNIADVQMVAVEEDSGAMAADKDLTKASSCSQDCREGTDYVCPAGEEVKQEVDGVGKSTSHSNAQSEGLHLTVKNNQMRDTELPNGKQVQNSGREEDEPKDNDDNQHILNTRSIANSYDSQETVTEKGEDMEVEKNVGPAGGEVDQMSDVTAGIDTKITEINVAPDSKPNKDTRKDKFKEEGDVSIVTTGLPTSTAILSSAIPQEEKQIVESAFDNAQANESNAVEETATEPVMPTKGDIGVSNTSGKLDFDLNEGFGIDETNQDDAMVSAASSFVVPISNASEMLMSNSSGLTQPIAVAAKAIGPLIPPTSPLRNKGEPGWKGSAATSAFRPAEPRKTPERQQATYEGPSDVLNSSGSGASGSQSRPHLNIDLNVPDEGIVEDGLVTHLSSRMKNSAFAGIDFMFSRREPPASAKTASAGRLDLDLNRTEDCEENGPVSTNTEDSSVKTFANGFSHSESHFSRGFDLNDGPLVEDSVIEPTQWNTGMKSKGNYPSHISGWGLNGELSNMKSWLPSGNTHSNLAIPSLHLDRNERSYPVVAAGATQHILNPAAGTPYGSDSYKGPVLSSSSAIAYPTPAQTTFPYGAFSFGTNFPLASTSFSGVPTAYMESSGTACFPTIPSQSVSAGAVPSSGVRPYMMCLADMPGTEGCRKWPRLLDLNAGPGAVESEVREDRVTSRQFSIADSQGSLEQQQSRAFYQTAGPAVPPLKRKEPEPSWDAHSIGYVQPHPWQ